MDKFGSLQPLQFPLKYLKFLGLWKDQKVKMSRQTLQICLHLLFCEVFVLLQLINIFTASNLNDITELLSILLTFVGFSIKSLNLIIRSDDVAVLIEDAKELVTMFGTENDLKALQRRVEQIHKTYKYNLVFVLISLSAIVINVTATFIKHSEPPYKVPHKFWAPFDYENNVYWFGIVAVYQIVGVIGTASAVVSLDFLPIFFLNFSSGLIEELRKKFGRICESEESVSKCENVRKNQKTVLKAVASGSKDITDEEFMNRIKQINFRRNRQIKLEKCIAIHLRIKAFVKKTEEIFSPAFFAQGSFSMIIICTVVFRLSKVI
jgi:7tm Odorant receptor